VAATAGAKLLSAADTFTGAWLSAGQRREWPDAHAFREAVQDLSLSASDPELASATIATDRLGLPVAYTGRFAVVFRVTLADGEEWALRCFTSAADEFARAARYHALSDRLAESGDLDGAFVDFRYLDHAVRIDGHAYPALLMRWADGVPLGAFVEERRADADALLALRRSLDGLLARLEEVGIAHGDWQHDNLLVSDGGRRVTLVDYDGLQARGLEALAAEEAGHPNYQHPARTAAHLGVGLDRFAHASLSAALLALAREPSLWDRFGSDDRVLFGATDFAAPDSSALFAACAELAKADGRLHAALDRLRAACAAPAPEVVSGAAAFTAPSGGWWRAGIDEAAAAAAPTGARRARVRTDGGSLAAGVGTGIRRGYRRRLAGRSERERERRNLTGLRAFSALATPAVVASWAAASEFPGENGAFSFVAALLTLSALYWLYAGFYLAWPRKRLYDELNYESGRLAHERRALADRLVRLRATAERARALPRRPHDARGARRHAEEQMRRVPISRAFQVPGVAAASVRAARHVGIETAVGLLRRGTPAGLYSSLPPEQAALLRAWVARLLRHHEEEFRRRESPWLALQDEAARVETRMAALDCRLAELEAERGAFPASTVAAYARWVAGRTARAVATQSRPAARRTAAG